MQHGDQSSIRAVYMRGGTSRALIFRREDLPERLRQAVGPTV